MSAVLEKPVTWINENGFDVETFCDHLWCLGCDRKNLWLEGFMEHFLNSINKCPMLFGGEPLLQFKLVLNERVGHNLNNLFLLVVKSASSSFYIH